MRDRTGSLLEAVRPLALQQGSSIDDWQWGADSDPSFGRGGHPGALRAARSELQQMTSAFTQALPVVLGTAESAPPLAAAEAVAVRVPALLDEEMMLAALARLLPRRLTDLLLPRREIYPDERLRLLASEASEAIEGTVRARPRNPEEPRQAAWLGLELLEVDPHRRDVARERAQMIDYARKAVIGRALGIERIYAGEIFDPERGAVRVRRDGRVVPRPVFLAMRTLAGRLAGAEFLGSFQLGAEVRNYVFRTPRQTALMAIWHESADRSAEVDIGTGLGNLVRIDMQENERPVGRVFEVGPAPELIDGFSVPLARTRMSIRIEDRPALRAQSERQTQVLSIRNFFREPLIATFNLQYAAYADSAGRLRLEPGWSSPAPIRLNLPPGGEDPARRVMASQRFEVRPTREAAGGRKFVRIETQLAAALETRFNLLRTTELTSEIEMRIEPVASPSETHKVFRLELLWVPDPTRPRAPRLDMKPYYQAAGEQHTYQGSLSLYPADSPEAWDEAGIRDIRIPLYLKGRRLWIGADEDGGSLFIRREITDLMLERDN